MNFINKFQEALRIPTVWPSRALFDDSEAQAPLLRFQEFLTENFPVFHNTAERHVLNPFSVIYHLPGTQDSDAVLLIAHYDVVPAEKEKWSVDPFGAELKDGYIYSRGSLDMKNVLISILEAAENLLAEGWKPKKDIWIALGGDEERSGSLGAKEAARWFERRGQRFEWILDEGTPIAEGQIKGIDLPLALVSIEEKGYLSLNLTVDQEPGHASRPPENQAAAILARALCRIAERPFPFMLSTTVEMFFARAASYMGGIQGFVMCHARALGPLFFKLAATTPTMASMLRNTVAMTQLSGSAADNVMPSQVRAVINLRLLWPWTVEKAIAFIKKAAADERVKVSVYGLGTDPVPASSDFMNHGWRELESAMNETWPGIPLFPFIMVATTDSRHYKDLTGCIFRFNPYKLKPEELNTIHGHDERISVENLHRGLSFYTSLLRLL
ncbi:MAG: M20/M25/M40 family metallo-hydrolase [Treponema sp.]|jgi:carboxypeptidase PM20D1|nr:M20/M25/M40 family metallo-hydrolase [Treponema sp.]